MGFYVQRSEVGGLLMFQGVNTLDLERLRTKPVSIFGHVTSHYIMTKVPAVTYFMLKRLCHIDLCHDLVLIYAACLCYIFNKLCLQLL